MTTTANFRKQNNSGWLVWLLLFILFVFALMVFGCNKPDDKMTARFFCDEPGCSVWYGVYDTDMRREVTGKCWQQTIDIEPGSTMMFNCETADAPATLLLSVYEGEDCIAFGQAAVEANSGGEILINY